MHCLLAISVLLATVTIAQSRRWFSPEVSCWITQEKVPASWEDAQRYCEIDGAVLASPLNPQLFNYMQSLINVHNHSAAYFIGTRANRLDDGQKVHYVSVEGRRLDDMPRAVFDAIDQLDLEQGDCLSMDRHGIRTVSCWDHLPYICYSNETTECGLTLATTQAPSTASRPTTTASIPAKTASTPTTTTSTLTSTASTPGTTTSTPTTTASTTSTTTSTLPPTTTLPPGYKYYSTMGSAYKFHHKRRVSWNIAKATCAVEGAHLVVLDDKEEADFVWGIVYDAVGHNSIWTGLHDNRPGGVAEWRTVLGEPVSNVYHEWFDGHPYNDARYACAYLYAYDKLLYNNVTCAHKLHFTCERAQ